MSMETASTTVIQYMLVYLWLSFTTFVNIIAPLPGSIVINPVIAYITDPQRAIGIGALIFFGTGMHRVYLFRSELSKSENKKIVRTMAPISILGALLSGFIIVRLQPETLVGAIVIASFFFVIQTSVALVRRKTRPLEIRPRTTIVGVCIAFVTGFLQAAGLPGSHLRGDYLRSRIPELSVRAVSSTIGMVNFCVTGLIVASHGRLTIGDLILILLAVLGILPFQAYGKKFLHQIPDVYAKCIGILMSLLGSGLLIHKYFVN